MRGRRPQGSEYVDKLEGSVEDKERLKDILDTMAGQLRRLQACAELDIGETRFWQLRDVAMQAGWDTEFLHAEEIGWQAEWNQFTDLHEKPIEICFKLYPWEWMVREQFGPHLLRNTTKWWEPPWKMLLSTKGLLPILHELFPDSPYVLPASFDTMPRRMHVRKPLHGREGANVVIVDENGKELSSTSGPRGGRGAGRRPRPRPDPPRRQAAEPVVGSAR